MLRCSRTDPPSLLLVPMSTLKRALAILDLFSMSTPVLTAEEIIGRLSYSAPTGYRYIRDLTELGYLLRMSEGYRLGPRIIELDHLIIDGDPVLAAARPIMRDVVAQVGGDVLLSAMHGLRIVNIHHEKGPHELGIPHGRGRPHPLFRGSTAKTILAYVPRKTLRKLYESGAQEAQEAGLGKSFDEVVTTLAAIRTSGFYLGVAEISPSRAGISVPVFQADGQIAGALSVTFPASRLETMSAEKVVALLRSAARRIEAIALSTRLAQPSESADS